MLRSASQRGLFREWSRRQAFIPSWVRIPLFATAENAKRLWQQAHNLWEDYRIAQWIEHKAANLEVTGSTPVSEPGIRLEESGGGFARRAVAPSMGMGRQHRFDGRGARQRRPSP